MDDFENDPEELKIKIRQISGQLEARIQENHELKLKLQQKTNIENDFKLENDTLLSELSAKELEVQKLLVQLKNASAVPITTEKDLRIEELQDQISFLETELNSARKELECDKKVEPVNNLDNTILEELANTKNELENMETIHKEKCAQMEELISNLNYDLEDKNRRLCHLESSVENLKEELTNCKEELEHCECEYQLLKTQMMSMQQSVVEKEVDSKTARGNSLFSEVEDNRLTAMAALKNTKKDAEQAVRNLASCQFEIHSLKVENLSLTRKWEEFVTNNSLIDKTEEAIIAKMAAMIKDLTKKLSEAEEKSLNLISDLLPDTVVNHQWLKSYLREHSSKENKLASKIRDLETRLLWAEEGQFIMKKKYNVQLAENVALKGRVEKMKMEASDGNQHSKQDGPRAILPADASEQLPMSAITPSREQALKRLLNNVYLKGKNTKTLQFAAEVQTRVSEDGESSESAKPAKKKTVKSIVTINTSGAD